MMINIPDISSYTDYAKYLQDAYLARRGTDKKFSQRFINHKMGTQSSGWFADILAGRKKLKLSHVAPMAAIFKLEPRAREFLRILVTLEQSNSLEEKTMAHEKWLELKGVSQEVISKDRFKYFDQWYYPVLRELLILRPFKGDYTALGSKLDPPIGPKKAKEAKALLERLGLIHAGAPAPLPVLSMNTSTRTKTWDKIMKAYAQLSIPALEKFKKEERDFSALTLPLSQKGLQKAGEEIAALRKRLLALSERDKTNDRVYQCLFQVFPVSNRAEVQHV